MKLEIITPEQTVFSGEAASVTLPGTQGLFEVLENHAPLVSSLAAGIIKYVDTNNIATEVEVGEGFVEINNNVLTACVEGAK